MNSNLNIAMNNKHTFKTNFTDVLLPTWKLYCNSFSNEIEIYKPWKLYIIYEINLQFNSTLKFTSYILLQSVLQDSDSDDSTAANGHEIADGFTVSDDIFNKLYPYQKEGVSWFWKLFQEKKGGILGDDMGLGKTIQVISFLSGMFEAEHIATVLIVMPVSLLTNWKKEFERW